MDELLQLLQNLNFEDEEPEMANIPFSFEFLKTVPEFDGRSFTLANFIRSAEVITNQYFIAQQIQPFQRNLILSALRTKLKDKALIITSGRDFDTWEDLKETLIRAFADQRSEDSLLRDLMLLKQKNESAQEYYEKCVEMKTLLYANIQLIEEDPVTRETKKTLYDSLTLKSFLSGLKEPLGSFLRAKGPNNLEQSLTYIIEEENVYYNRARFAEANKNNSYNHNQKKHSFSNNLRMVKHNSYKQPNFGNHFNNPQDFNYQFQQAQPFAFSNNQFQRTQPFAFSNNQRPFNNNLQRPNFNNFPRQQNFGNQNYNQPRNSTQARNVFAPQNRPQPRPTPMDTTSANTRRPQNQSRQFIRQGNPRQANFISEELYYQNLDNYNENYDEIPNEYDDEIQNENFTAEASTSNQP